MSPPNSETIFLRGPQRIKADLEWFKKLAQELLRTGSPEERSRILWYLVPSIASTLFSLILVTYFAIQNVDTLLEVGIYGLAFAFLLYLPLLDLTRRIRPLNSGQMRGAAVSGIYIGRGHLTITTQTRSRTYDSHLPLFMFSRSVKRGQQVTLALHPNDKRIAAVIDATPNAIFSDAKRAECARYLQSHYR